MRPELARLIKLKKDSGRQLSDHGRAAPPPPRAHLEQQLLKNADVICTTCTGAGYRRLRASASSRSSSTRRRRRASRSASSHRDGRQAARARRRPLPAGPRRSCARRPPRPASRSRSLSASSCWGCAPCACRCGRGGERCCSTGTTPSPPAGPVPHAPVPLRVPEQHVLRGLAAEVRAVDGGGVRALRTSHARPSPARPAAAASPWSSAPRRTSSVARAREAHVFPRRRRRGDLRLGQTSFLNRGEASAVERLVTMFLRAGFSPPQVRSSAHDLRRPVRPAHAPPHPRRSASSRPTRASAPTSSRT